MQIKMITKNGKLPQYKTAYSAGVDLEAYINEPITLKPLERQLVHTGLFIELPPGYEAQLRARSGLSIKNGITLVNGIGTIDADYRGEICIPIINLGDKSFTINNGDRIAQMVIAKYESPQFVAVDELTDTDRGTGGFGSTGV